MKYECCKSLWLNPSAKRRHFQFPSVGVFSGISRNKQVDPGYSGTIFKQQEGLSLIEIMIAICLVSIIAGLATVSLEPLWKKHQLRLAVSNMTGTIQLFRMKAIIEKRTFQLKIENRRLYYRGRLTDQWESWSNWDLYTQVEYSMSGTTSFYSKGFASPKTITVTRNEFHQKIIININGKTRTSEIF